MSRPEQTINVSFEIKKTTTSLGTSQGCRRNKGYALTSRVNEKSNSPGVRRETISWSRTKGTQERSLLWETNYRSVEETGNNL